MNNHNSVVNQDIKRKFVDREVRACFSYEMDEILRAEIVSYDDIENLYEYRCPQCGEVIKEDEEGNYTCAGYKCDYTAPDSHMLEQEPQEIFEWWIVTEFLYNKLKEKGEPVLEWGNNYYWGRTTTGQAILLDGVISDICSDMEILEGQKNDLSK